MFRERTGILFKQKRKLILLLAFPLGILLASTVSRAQSAHSAVTTCFASCSDGMTRASCERDDNTGDSLDCSGLGTNQICTCSCSADNLNNGECNSSCQDNTGSNKFCQQF
jgi:hypothetical protein